MDTTLWGTILFVSIVSMTPGPNNLLLAASGANYGFFRTLPHMCGVIVGFAIMVVASGFGLGMILNEFPQVILPLKIMSVSFLMYLSWRVATGGAHVVDGKSQPLTFLPAVLFQTINPKGISFLLSIMGAQVSDAQPLFPQLIPLFILLPAFTVLSAVTWTMFGTAIGKLMQSQGAFRVFNLIMASLLVACAIPIAFS
ncbi:putative threonine efflux protein [Rhodobacteraceae bacterium HIMB11]|nr:putative threonine efflux protein [Rhodobacteraceae bacterium HIMB11]